MKYLKPYLKILLFSNLILFPITTFVTGTIGKYGGYTPPVSPTWENLITALKAMVLYNLLFLIFIGVESLLSKRKSK